MSILFLFPIFLLKISPFLCRVILSPPSPFPCVHVHVHVHVHVGIVVVVVVAVVDGVHHAHGGATQGWDI